ncbi:hypothetical protein HBB16_07050 [Pseudonocardia sp. MCCB 268]|nr:hypothetical protein [Pseudonocardia cytotoxica]
MGARPESPPRRHQAPRRTRHPRPPRRPPSIPGLGPITPTPPAPPPPPNAAAPRWIFTITDPDSYLLLAGPCAATPLPVPRTARNHQGAPEHRGRARRIGHTAAGARRSRRAPHQPRRTRPPRHRPQLADWHPVLAEIAHAWADRDTRRARLDADPTARFARGPLAHPHPRPRPHLHRPRLHPPSPTRSNSTTPPTTTTADRPCRPNIGPRPILTPTRTAAGP